MPGNFGIYVHVPFCLTRCGYCDFNTYTAGELGGRPGGPAVSPASYPDLVLLELDLARNTIARSGPVLRADTVFFGGGTPTLLDPARFARIVDGIGARFGLAPDAEITTEANPETVTPESLRALRRAGVTRISLGMQSAVPGVLATLDRTHRPGLPERCVRWARDAGFEHISLDLIYGTPGESNDDWRRSVTAAIGAGPDHVSAYALTVEPGTRLAAQVRRGELAAPDDDVLAARYLIADELLSEAGYQWYEISNWARDDTARCRHNMLYWTGGDWWGIGPGAHSHLEGVRWWNVKHPATYAQRLDAGQSPAQDREELTPEQRELERVMLAVRLADGLPLPPRLAGGHGGAVAGLVADGLAVVRDDRLLLTRRGRLLADTVIRALT